MEESKLTPALRMRVEQALDAIRPYLKADGGDIKILDVDVNMVLKLELLGNCSSCSISGMTLKAGVEETVRKSVPEISKVEAINLTSPDDPDAWLPDRTN